MSDMTANIIKKQLIEYTKTQCVLWDIPLTAGVPSGFFWNRKTNSWENQYTEMLIVNDRKILLVRKYIDMKDFNEPVAKPASRQRFCPKLDAFKPIIDEWLENALDGIVLSDFQLHSWDPPFSSLHTKLKKCAKCVFLIIPCIIADSRHLVIERLL